MNGKLRAEVTDRFGTAAEIIDLDAVLGKLSPHQRGLLSSLAANLVRDLVSVFGGSEDHARKVAVADLLRLAADESAYERVAERRGLLPL